MTADAVGGVWGYALELADGLAAENVEIELVTMGPAPRRDQLRQLHASAVSSFRHGAFALEWQDDPWDDVERAGDWLLGIAAGCGVDVIHLNGYAHAALPWNAPVVVAGHSCVLSWHQAVRGAPAGAECARYRRAVARGLRAADVVVAPTAAMLAELERLYAPRGECLVIANGRDATAFRPQPKEPFVAGLGRLWDEAKNLDALDRAAGALPWPVLLAGSPGGRVCRSARLLGRLGQDEAADLLGRAALFAAPARYEPFGMAALEAGLSGCALVLGDIPSLREVWDEAAAFVEPDDADALADRLLGLIGDARALQRAGTAARRRALGYSRVRMSAAYGRVYERLPRVPGARSWQADEVPA
jgi:glycosyltransferase involved in cell wall biosynthesis